MKVEQMSFRLKLKQAMPILSYRNSLYEICLVLLTLQIEQEYPDLYPYFDESPNTIPSSSQPKIDVKFS